MIDVLVCKKSMEQICEILILKFLANFKNFKLALELSRPTGLPVPYSFVKKYFFFDCLVCLKYTDC